MKRALLTVAMLVETLISAMFGVWLARTGHPLWLSVFGPSALLAIITGICYALFVAEPYDENTYLF